MNKKILSILLVLCMVITLQPMTARAATGNLIANPGGETVTEYNNLSSNGWKEDNYPVRGYSYEAFSNWNGITLSPHSGKYLMGFLANASSNYPDGVSCYQDIVVTTQTSYNFSGFLCVKKDTSGSATLSLEALDNEGNRISSIVNQTVTTASVASGDWIQVSQSGTIPTGTNKLRVTIKGILKKDGLAAFDDLSLVLGESPLPVSSTPTATVTTVSKTSEAQKSVNFTLTNNPVYKDSQKWKVYSDSTADTLASGVTAANNGNTLTLTHALNVPATTYYISVTEDGKKESARLALTVGDYIAPVVYVAEIEGTKYKTLQEAVDAVPSGKEIKMLTDTTLTTAVTVSGVRKDFVLDLNGKTIDGGDNSAIIKTCEGTLTITDRSDGAKGKITSKKLGREDSCGTIYMDYGKLVLENGTVENSYVDDNPDYSYAIYNFRSSDVTILGGEVLTSGNGTSTICNSSGGTMTISGGKVRATGNKSSAIAYYRWGTLNISGGEISCSGSQSQTISVSNSQNASIQGGTITNTNSSGVTISSESQGTISISGGIVSAPGGGTAIRVDNNGKINISGKDTLITGSGWQTIELYGGSETDTVLTMKGGTIENTKGVYAIYSKSKSKISVSGSTSVIRGVQYAMDKEPVLGDTTEVIASTSYAGLPVVEYTPGNIKSYKYLQFKDNPDLFSVKNAKKIIESSIYTAVQEKAATKEELVTELAVQINKLNGWKTTEVIVTASDITVSPFQAATAGTSAKPEGTNGSFKFKVLLKKGIEEQTTAEMTGTITATEYTDSVALAEAKSIIEKGSYTVAQASADSEEAVKIALAAQINKLPGISATGVTVTDTQCTVYDFESAKAGTASSPTGINGSCEFSITLSKNGKEQNTIGMSVTITATAYTDTMAVAEAKSIIEKGSYTIAQATANTESGVQTALLAQINTLIDTSTTGVTVKGIDIVNFKKASEGSYIDTAGADGSFQFNVSLEKNSAKQTTADKSGTITATAFTDTMAVEAAKAYIVDGSITVEFGADKTAEVQKYVNSKLINNAVGVKATVSYNSSNSYKVALEKGKVTDSKSITMTINEKANPDIALVASAKSIIEGVNYTLEQDTANTETAVQTVLATQINALSDMKDTGVILTASDITLSDFTAPVAGTSGKPAGKNGSFTFTVSLTKGEVKQTTTGKSVTIMATQFTGVTDAEAVAAARAAIVDGTVTVDFGAEQTAKIAAVQVYVNSKLTGDATGVNAIVTPSIDNTYEVLLKKGEETYRKIITITIKENANPDIAKVDSAKSIIEAGSYTVAQASITTGGAITTAIAVKINTLTGMSSTTVVVTGSSITVSEYTPAQEGTPGTPAGKNGSFTFSVSLMKGAVGLTTAGIQGVITAMPYTGLTDAAAVDAAKAAVENGVVTVDFGAQQTTKTAAVQNYVNNLLIGDAAGVTATVTHSGNNFYLVTLKKGETTDSKTITMTINENANPDNALVEEAKIIVAGGSYTLSQAAANTETAVKTALAAQINALPGMSSKGVTVTASDITITQFTAPVAGTSANIAGTNGSFTFHVSLTKGAATTFMAGKTGSITATTYVAPSGGNNPPAAGGGAGAPAKKEGKIEKDQKQEGNAPVANLKDSTEDLKAKVLSAADQEQMAAGKDAKVILKVQDISASVSEEDKKQIEEKLAAEQPNTVNPAVLYIDISLYKKVGDGEETRVTETSGKIKISVEVPESMWNTETGIERTYRVVRIHNGVTEVLEGTYDTTTHLFTFETDRFSTYALTYQDLNVISVDMKQSQAGPIALVQDFNHLRLTAKAAKTSQKLSYAKVTGADGYLIYGAQYGKKLKKLADVEGTVRSYTVKKLKKGTYYTYQVKAYKLVDGKRVIIAESSLIHSITTSKTYGNPIKINIKKSSITLAVGKMGKVTYQVVLPENKKMKEFASSVRFETTNQEIATITKSGKITAKAKGTCDVYVYAQNGVYKKIKITVE